jgi:hypothetical protein
VEDFDSVHVEDREFKLAGQTFRWRPIPYMEGLEQLARTVREEVADEDGAEEIEKEKLSRSDVAERTIESYERNTERKIENLLLFLVPEDRERFKAAIVEGGVSMHQIDALQEWLGQKQTERPTEAPSLSDAGRGTTAPISQAA